MDAKEISLYPVEGPKNWEQFLALVEREFPGIKASDIKLQFSPAIWLFYEPSKEKK